MLPLELKVIKAYSLEKSESINKKLSDSARTKVENNRLVLHRTIEIIVPRAKQNIPLRGHTEETSNFYAILSAFAQNDELLSEHIASAQYNAKFTSPDIQNELIDICAEQVKERILSDCPYFAIIVDEATDKSTKEQLSLCVRFVDNKGTVREEFLGFLQCASVKGIELCANSLSFFQEADLDVLKVRAQCYDGASNMSGKYRGVQALVRERSPHANYVHCKAHCLNLALVHSSNIPNVRTMKSTVQDISFLLGYSAKRLAAFVDELPLTRKQSSERNCEMETHILGNEDRFAAQYRLPNRLPGLQDEMRPSIYAAYAPDLQHSFEAFGNEGGEFGGISRKVDHLGSKIRSDRRAKICTRVFMAFSEYC
ncbi:zinc finger MYM-type protein 1-like [Mya arenaria]|uniref:zinc finger MYM-type protein 1-like n=1 Tax=Mya arenaria TaxID=6604 RepID=UPI0022E2CDC8|nr:zinc finger MYM-type protein 1-like [Mya arenaria]